MQVRSLDELRGPGERAATVAMAAELVVTSTALFVDTDGGLADTFAADPADPACQGTRGTGAWVDCGLGAGAGLNG